MAGCESMCNWRNVEEDEQFEQLFGLGELRKGTAAHNTSPSEAHIDSLPGGTAAMTFGRLSQYVKYSDCGVDATGLARWCWQMIRSSSKTVRFISVY